MPNLDIKALRKQIEDKQLGLVYLLMGDDVKLVSAMVDAMETVVPVDDRPFAIEHLYAGDEAGSPVNITTSARMMPMLGDRRIVVVLRAERLLKPRRNAKAEEEELEEGTEDDLAALADLGAIEEYLESPVPSTTLVFVATEIDKTRRLTKRLLDKAQVVQFGGLAGGAPSDVTAILRGELARAGMTIEPRAAARLVELSGNDITKLRGDIERLLLFVGDRRNVTFDDVDEIAADHNVVSDDWGVTNAIAAGNAAAALDETGRRFDRGDSPHQLVGQLRWWVSSTLAAADPGRVKPALEALLRTDLALKSSGGDARILVERLVVELTGRPVQSRGGWR